MPPGQQLSIVVLLFAMACAPARVMPVATVSSDASTSGTAVEEAKDQSWRNVKPAVEPLQAVTLPSVERQELRNGIPVYLVENHEVPLVLARVLVNAGTCSEAPGKTGFANFVTSLLSNARVDANRLPLTEELEQRGGTIHSGTTSDFSFIGLEALTADWERSLNDLARVIQHPLIQAEEFDRHRAETLAELRKTADLGAQLSIQALRFILHGPANPCGAPVAGTPASIRHLTLQDVLNFHRRHWSPAHFAVLLVGDFDRQSALKVLNDAFGRLPRSSKAVVRKAQTRAPAAPRFVIINRPGAAQANFAIGHIGPSLGSEDWAAVTVMTRALGGYYFSRITKNLRIEKGYIYGANFIDNAARLAESIVSIRSGVGVDVGGATVVEIMKEIRGIIDTPPRDEELKRAQISISNGMVVRLQGNSQIAAMLQDVAANNLPADYLNRFYEKLRRVTSEDVADAARKFLSPQELSIVVVGPSERLERDQQLRSLGNPQVLSIEQIFEDKTAASAISDPSRGGATRSGRARATARP